MPEWFDKGRRVGQDRTGCNIFGQFQAVAFDINIDHVEERSVVIVSIRQPFSEVRREVHDPVMQRIVPAPIM